METSGCDTKKIYYIVDVHQWCTSTCTCMYKHVGLETTFCRSRPRSRLPMVSVLSQSQTNEVSRICWSWDQEKQKCYKNTFILIDCLRWHHVKILFWVVNSSEKNWWLQLDVSIGMLWSSSGAYRSEHTDRSIPIEISSCNQQFFSEIFTTQKRIFTWCHRKHVFTKSFSPCKATSLT